jgi:energy-coupling factor transporter ATP-binding protein EcfA2
LSDERLRKNVAQARNNAEQAPLKVVMIGHTGVGKTTYMAALYGAMQHSLRGFRLRAKETDDHRRLLGLAHAIDEGHYPANTDQRSEYVFSLRHHDDEVVEFKWSDYRGQAIRESGKTSEQAGKLQQDLKDADGLMLFCDSEALATGQTQTNQLGRLISLAQYALRDIETPMALAVVLTKSDSISGYTREMVEYFSGLISAIVASETVSGALIPTACGVQSSNVHIPLFFIIHSIVALQAEQAAREIERTEQYAQDLDSSSRGLGGALGWLLSRATGSPTDRERYEQVRMQLNHMQQMHEKVIESIRSFSSSLTEFPTIEEGRGIDDYVRYLEAVRQKPDETYRSTQSLWKL